MNTVPTFAVFSATAISSLWVRTTTSMRIGPPLSAKCSESTEPIGTPDRCIDTLKRKAAQGITYFVCLFTDGGQPETVRLFGEKVLPAFR